MEVRLLSPAFYVYTTLVDRSRTDGKAFMNVVFFAKNPSGPWSEPIDLRIYGQIDPGYLTAGPPTAHMAVAARSTSPTGPWEDSPYNPLVHTASKDEVFWRQGHGQLIDDVDGNWWMLYTGYNKDIGPSKLTLLVPMVWTEDGWPIVKPGVDVTDVMMKPLYQWGKRDRK